MEKERERERAVGGMNGSCLDPTILVLRALSELYSAPTTECVSIRHAADVNMSELCCSSLVDLPASWNLNTGHRCIYRLNST
jgi:hypothetical protein